MTKSLRRCFCKNPMFGLRDRCNPPPRSPRNAQFTACFSRTEREAVPPAMRPFLIAQCVELITVWKNKLRRVHLLTVQPLACVAELGASDSWTVGRVIYLHS